MPYAKRKYTGTFRKIKAKNYRKKTSSVNNRSDIVALDKRVNILYKKVTRKSTPHWYRYTQSDQNLSANYYIKCLNFPAAWSPCFNADANEGEASRAFHQFSKYNFRFDVGDENAQTTLTMFIVTLKQKAVQLLDGSKQLSSLSNESDYIFQDGRAMLNPLLFNIKMVKRFTLTGVNAGDITLADYRANFKDTYKEYYFSDKRKYMMSMIPSNTNQTWRTLSEGNLRISSRLYMIVFNDNSGADFEYPVVKHTYLHKVSIP